MKGSKFFVAPLVALSLAATALPARAQGQGRGGPPPVVSEKATPEIMRRSVAGTSLEHRRSRLPQRATTRN